ncbi:MAG: hypothetical protein IJJ98_01435 [Prevotella sp.]|nr:hypothetical protein [Prevotella sp.]
MINELEIRTLTERFFNGETTLAEEHRLYQLYSEAESLPADLEELREMMADLRRLSPLPLPAERGVITHRNQKDILLPSIQGGAGGGSSAPSRRGWGWISIAASLLLFFTLGSMWYGYQQKNECVAYVYGERVTDRELVMHEMQTAMASLTTDDATATMEQQMKELFSE